MEEHYSSGINRLYNAPRARNISRAVRYTHRAPRGFKGSNPAKQRHKPKGIYACTLQQLHAALSLSHSQLILSLSPSDTLIIRLMLYMLE